jgi:DNA-binding NtrC family response regulator
MTHRGSILIVDDEEKILAALGRARDAGHLRSRPRARARRKRLLAERSFDAAGRQHDAGVERARSDPRVQASTPEGERPQILMTAHATIESALEAMSSARSTPAKPFEIDELLVVVRRASAPAAAHRAYRYLVNERDEQFDHYGTGGRSRAMEEVITRAELVAETKSTVLITGETGTGKELVARAVDRSAQRDMPLIKVNCWRSRRCSSRSCSATARRIHRRDHHQKGKFALADGGTIFPTRSGR